MRERIAYRPLRGAPRLVPLISAIGVSFFLQDAIRLVESLTTGQFYRVFPTFGNFDRTCYHRSHTVWDVDHRIGHPGKITDRDRGSRHHGGGLNYLVNATKLGKAIRSTAQDRTTASLMGINVNFVISMTFLIGGTLGGAAGVLYAMKFTRIDPFVGFFPGIKAFTAAVLGGIGNITGALLGGIVLGMLETFAGSYLSCVHDGRVWRRIQRYPGFRHLDPGADLPPSGLLGEQVGQKA